MAISFMRPDPASPAAIEAATFALVRRGYDPDQVRALLTSLSAELARLQARERQLVEALDRAEAQLAEVDQRPRLGDLDEPALVEVAGAEAARLLRDAKSEAEAILRSAHEGAIAWREEELRRWERRRSELEASAAAEREAARTEGREMVSQAREYREQVLADLARRREAALAQLEQLAQGRDRIVQAFERARLAAVDVLDELDPRPAHEPAAAEPAPVEEAADSVSEESVPAAEPVEPVPAEPAPVVDAADAVPEESVPSAEPVVVPRRSVDELFARIRAGIAVSPAAPSQPEPSRPEPGQPEPSQPEPGRSGPGETAPRAQEPDEPEPTEPEPGGDGASADRAALDDLAAALTSAWRRVLADEQNEVLSAVAAAGRGAPALDDLVGSPADHAARYLAAAERHLVAAASAGVMAAAGAGVAADVAPPVWEPSRTLIADAFTGPRRQHLANALATSAESSLDPAVAIRAHYRHWRQMVEPIAVDAVSAAYDAGVAATVPGAAAC